MFISNDYREWKDIAGHQILAQRAKAACKSLPLGPYAVHVLVPVSDRGDIDNRNKALMDLLHQMGVTPDDALLYDQRTTRSGNVARGTVRVTAWSLSDDEVAAMTEPAPQA